MTGIELGQDRIYPASAIRMITDGSKDFAVPFHTGGMTLRQHFAGLALQGLLANSDDRSVSSSARQCAEIAVDHADALLDELARAP